jgi:hypothetical protein
LAASKTSITAATANAATKSDRVELARLSGLSMPRPVGAGPAANLAEAYLAETFPCPDILPDGAAIRPWGYLATFGHSFVCFARTSVRQGSAAGNIENALWLSLDHHYRLPNGRHGHGLLLQQDGVTLTGLIC